MLLEAILAPGALTTLFQPIVEIREGQPFVDRIECLTRGPENSNAHRADVLFAYARKKGAEPEVDRAAAHSALQSASILPPHLELSINATAATLSRDRGFPEFLRRKALAYGINIARVLLEITEQSPTLPGQHFEENLWAMRNLGMKIALDDVGLANSNFAMMLDVKPDYFKLDKYLVQGAHKDRYRQAVIKSVQTLAENFGARVIAEGIEDLADLHTVLDVGITLVQGFLFGRPGRVPQFLGTPFLERVGSYKPPCRPISTTPARTELLEPMEAR